MLDVDELNKQNDTLDDSWMSFKPKLNDLDSHLQDKLKENIEQRDTLIIKNNF